MQSLESSNPTPSSLARHARLPVCLCLQNCSCLRRPAVQPANQRQVGAAVHDKRHRCGQRQAHLPAASRAHLPVDRCVPSGRLLGRQASPGLDRLCQSMQTHPTAGPRMARQRPSSTASLQSSRRCQRRAWTCSSSSSRCRAGACTASALRMPLGSSLLCRPAGRLSGPAVTPASVQVLNLLPVTAPDSAKGWLDTTYLDDDLRVSRGDKGVPGSCTSCCLHCTCADVGGCAGNLFVLKIVDREDRP